VVHLRNHPRRAWINSFLVMPDRPSTPTSFALS
jgi:hypothetical protein